MKLYIYAANVDIDTSMFKGSPFSCHTGYSYYDEFLNKEELAYKQTAKNRTGEIVMMSPNEYYENCRKYAFNEKYSVEHLKQSRRYDADLNEKYKKQILHGKKFFMPYLNVADGQQEGLHRMMVVGDLYGWDTKFPVLVVTAYDQQLEEENKLFEDFQWFKNHQFYRICKQAANELSYEYTTPPENIEELLKAEILKLSKDYYDGESYDIDVELESKVIDDCPVIYIYLSRYFDYVPEMLAEPTKIWLENYFDLNVQDTTEAKPDNLDNIDSLLDDIDILDLFFKKDN